MCGNWRQSGMTATKKAPAGAFQIVKSGGRALARTPADRRVRSMNRTSDLLEVGGRHLAVAAGFEVVGDLVALVEAIEARALDRRDMHEGILAAIFRGDEAVALGGIE